MKDEKNPVPVADFLNTTENIHSRHGHLHTLKTSLPENGLTVQLDYIADRRRLDYRDFCNYLETRTINNSNLEDFLVTFLSHINNELVPRWVRLCFIQQHPHGQETLISEDRQPGWPTKAEDTNILLSLK